MQVGGAEVVAPFADAVGFIDGDAGDFTLCVDGVQVPPERFGEAKFGGHVEEPGERVSAAQVIDDTSTLGGRCVGV